MDSKLINKISSTVNRYSSNNVNSTGTTRWNEVFGEAQNKITQQTTTRQANATNPINNYSGGSGSSITSLNLGINPRVVDYNTYKSFNDLEKSFQTQGIYKAEDIANPYHHTKTNNHFKIDIIKEFENVYGSWDGKAKEGYGFAYVDKYGYSHVSDNFFDALIYSKDGKVYNYDGKTKGGDAIDANGNRIWLAGLDGSKPYGNAMPLNDADKELMLKADPNIFNTDSLAKNPSYTDNDPNVFDSIMSVNTRNYELYQIPVYYGRIENSDSNSITESTTQNTDDYMW